jgi:hypothetical protein
MIVLRNDSGADRSPVVREDCDSAEADDRLLCATGWAIGCQSPS